MWINYTTSINYFDKILDEVLILCHNLEVIYFQKLEEHPLNVLAIPVNFREEIFMFDFSLVKPTILLVPIIPTKGLGFVLALKRAYGLKNIIAPRTLPEALCILESDNFQADYVVPVISGDHDMRKARSVFKLMNQNGLKAQKVLATTSKDFPCELAGHDDILWLQKGTNYYDCLNYVYSVFGTVAKPRSDDLLDHQPLIAEYLQLFYGTSNVQAIH